MRNQQKRVLGWGALVSLVFMIGVVEVVREAKGGAMEGRVLSSSDVGTGGGYGGVMTEGLEREMAGYLPMIDELMGYVARNNRGDSQMLLRTHLTRQDLVLERKLVGELTRFVSGNGPYDGYELVAVQRVSSRLHRLHMMMHYRDKVVKAGFWLREYQGKWYFTEADLEEGVLDFRTVAPYVYLLEPRTPE